MLRHLLLILFISIATCSIGQSILVIDNYRSKDRNEFFTGDEITFTLGQSSEKYTGTIQAMRKNILFVSDVAVPIDSISNVYVNYKPENKAKLQGAKSVASKAAWIIPTIALLNPLIIDDSEPINAQNVIISALAISTPFYVDSRKNRKAKIGATHRIRILNFSDLDKL